MNNGQVEIKEDVVELQERYNNKNIEDILISILKGGEEDE